jgi:hypothetical protein
VLAEEDPASPPPGDSLARTSRRDPRAAARTERRARTAGAVPDLGATVERGDASGEHLDVVGDVLARLPEPLRGPFSAAHGAQLAFTASTGTPGELRALATSLATRFEDEQSRQTRFERQQRANRLRTWIDRVTGMVRLSGELDPEHGQAFLRRLQDEVEAQFHTGVPDTAPDDPGERQDHLRALALCGLVLGAACVGVGATTSRRPETITVIDVETFEHRWHPDSYVDLGVDGLELPLDTIRRRAVLGDVVPVWVDADGVVIRVGEPACPLDLGRTTRLANRTQRRALRVMYATCAVPGCAVRYDHCQPHHIIWWECGGGTDLRNLVPVCSRHHGLVHRGGWVLAMARNRSLTVTLPDGTVMQTGPPRSERR